MKKSKPWFVYIIRTDNDRLYTGITTDIERRFIEHFASKKGAKFFRGQRPSEIVFIETYKNRSEASIREAAIKKMSRKLKDQLVKAFDSLNSSGSKKSVSSSQ